MSLQSLSDLGINFQRYTYSYTASDDAASSDTKSVCSLPLKKNQNHENTDIINTEESNNKQNNQCNPH